MHCRIHLPRLTHLNTLALLFSGSVSLCSEATNLLAKKLKAQQEVVRKKEFHLLLLSDQLKERKRDPHGVLGPTPQQQKEAWQKELVERAHKARAVGAMQKET